MAVGRLQTVGYVGAVVLCFLLGMLAGWNGFGLARRIDNQKYDLLAQDKRSVAREAVIVAINEATLESMGRRGRRRSGRRIGPPAGC
jgi:CHASE2 domain-containing sensor protein